MKDGMEWFESLRIGTGDKPRDIMKGSMFKIKKMSILTPNKGGGKTNIFMTLDFCYIRVDK